MHQCHNSTWKQHVYSLSLLILSFTNMHVTAPTACITLQASNTVNKYATQLFISNNVLYTNNTRFQHLRNSDHLCRQSIKSYSDQSSQYALNWSMLTTSHSNWSIRHHSKHTCNYHNSCWDCYKWLTFKREGRVMKIVTHHPSPNIYKHACNQC